MSTDLQSPPGLPVIRLRPDDEDVQTRQPSTEEEEEQQENNKERIQDQVNQTEYVSDDDDEEDECQTPKSNDHKIPMIVICPPAPRKRRPEILCKRKISDDLQFFEITGRHEIQSFFSSCFDTKKRAVNWSTSNSFTKKS